MGIPVSFPLGNPPIPPAGYTLGPMNINTVTGNLEGYAYPAPTGDPAITSRAVHSGVLLSELPSGEILRGQADELCGRRFLTYASLQRLVTTKGDAAHDVWADLQPPPAGYYQLIPYLAATVDTPFGTDLAVSLCPPDCSFGQNPLAPSGHVNVNKLGVAIGVCSATNNTFGAFVSSAIGPGVLSTIIVPPTWFLRFFSEGEGAGSFVPAGLLARIRALVFELPIDVEATAR